jgi:type IV secretion system protein VirD4
VNVVDQRAKHIGAIVSVRNYTLSKRTGFPIQAISQRGLSAKRAKAGHHFRRECALADSHHDRFERALREDLPRGLHNSDDKLARAMWADPASLGAEWDFDPDNPQCLFLGYRQGRDIGWSDDRHALTVAGTRAGKGTSLIVPNLLLNRGSVLVIDPKGELAGITGRKREQLGKLVILDPFDENGVWPTGHYNPLDELDPGSAEVIDQAESIASALVVYSGHGDPHWTQAARGVLRALILMVLTLEERYRNLVSVREFLMLTHPVLQANAEAQKIPKDLALIEMLIVTGDNFERVVQGQGEALKAMHEKERESVLSETRTQTQFLDSPSLRRILLKSDFSLKDLNQEVLSVFLCLPARHMDTHDRWLRVIVNLAISALEPSRKKRRARSQGRVPVLLLLEEFPVLRHMEKLEAAAGQLAGSGVKLWIIIQNLGQLKRHYDKGWETFIANAGVLMAFDNADLETLEYLSKKLGRVGMKVERATGASLGAQASGALRTQEDLREGLLLELDEAAEQLAREKGRAVILAAGRPPLMVERAMYFKDPLFRGLFDT